MTSKQTQTIISTNNPYIVLNNQGRILHRLELKANQHILGRDPQQADLRVPDDWQVISRCQACLRKVGDDYQIYDGDSNQPSRNGLFIKHTRITPTEGYALKNGMELQIGQNPENMVILTYFNPSNPQTFAPPTQRFISLKNKSVMLGRDSNANLQLDAHTVSRRHATIDSDGRGRYILQDHSTNGVFVNGQRVNSSAVLSTGARILIGPYTLILQGDELTIADLGEHIRLDAYNLVREVKDKNNKKRRLLNDISLPIQPGQFIALVGGSGAGKSTLMRTLLGIDPTTEGLVYLNGEHLRANFNIYRTQIGYVPQDDIIHKELKVGEVLAYAAKLRLPPDINIEEVVERTLQQIEMSHRRDVLVSQLSGGQRKRVSIGVELLADPKLFFLDEPTSGLDPGLDKKMMELLRKLANQGRTVILVTHATSNITLCDRIVFLGQGGRLCYFGPPQEAMNFFGITQGDFADIYNKLENEQNVVTEAEKFTKSDYYQRYITNHLSIRSQQLPTTAPPQQIPRSFLQQLILLTQRGFQLIQRDPINLGLSLLTAPIGISLITLAIKDKNPLILGTEPDPTLAPLALRVLFVFTCASIWVGLSSSLQEIVKEAAIYLRERLVNLGLFAYLGAKGAILGGLALIQTILIAIVILIGFKSPSTDLISWSLGLGITTFLTLFTCMSLGLMVSAIVKNASQANSALPLLLLPQIIFSGVLFKMEGIGSKISWLMLSRWSVGAYGTLVNVNAMVPQPTKLPDGSTIPLPFEATPVYEHSWGNLGLNWGILLLHLAVYFTVTWVVQKRKDIF
ncbi:FHA domain-containing protein [Limnofasciculus baicalensis]|uniref:ATP-binding cassette domain-containing protein n=1 Tax=Limnofasciculus baicalensis BBK-W-15 TaxID=2699891 RepID=A0AAE3GPM0_9CYAN|nr:FHA domain-containing protein [Limnofasciculus baicalensis]MCP2727824.1 ATP-binding cassette domain-containing protein [Limnofasciculus baicalensis BBK-W-15]